MRILYLTENLPDYLSDQIYVGLWKILRPEQVIDYPYKTHYHDSTHRLHYISQVPGRRYEEDEILDLLRSKYFDILVLSSSRRGGVAVLDTLSRKVTLPPRVLIDGEDDACIRQELFYQHGFALYFKREFRTGWNVSLSRRVEFGGDQNLFARTYALPFSIDLDTLPSPQGVRKDVDISYVARASHPKRLEAVRLLGSSHGLRFEGGLYAEPTDRQSKLRKGIPRLLTKLKGDPVVTSEQLGKRLSSTEYYALLARSKMALSLRGGGFDTLRYWEVAASKTLLVSEKPDIVIPNNFEHGRHALFCRSDLRDLVDLVQNYVGDEKKCLAMADAGYAHLVNYHTVERRAEYFIDLCTQRL